MNSEAGSISIRSAALADLPAIASLAEVIWRRHYPGIITVAQIDYMLARMFAPDEMARQLAAGTVYEQLLLDGRLIGFAAHGLSADPAERRLDKLYVLVEFQRRGHGGMLLRHVMEAARRLGCTRLTLTVNKRNRNAIAAYQKNGFDIRESVVVDIGGGFVMDDFVMSRRL